MAKSTAYYHYLNPFSAYRALNDGSQKKDREAFDVRPKMNENKHSRRIKIFERNETNKIRIHNCSDRKCLNKQIPARTYRPKHISRRSFFCCCFRKIVNRQNQLFNQFIQSILRINIFFFARWFRTNRCVCVIYLN